MKALLVLFLLIPSIAAGGVVSVTWEPVTHREDGTEVQSLAGYNLYFQRVGFAEQLIEVQPENTQQSTPEIFGLYEFSVSATETVDGKTIEGQRSEPVSRFVYPAPTKVQLQTVECIAPAVCESPVNE